MDTKEQIKRKQTKRKKDGDIVQLKEYYEILCSKCIHKLDVDKTLTMVDGYRGVCLCPHCGKKNKVVKVRPNDDAYRVSVCGTRTRRIPKLKMSKKARRRVNKELRDDNQRTDK